MIDIDAERAAVVAEARAWLRTPYHHMGRVKGAGVDCATLLAEVYANAGVIPMVTIPYYPPDWHLHRDAERYLAFVLDYAEEISSPSLRPGQPLFAVGPCGFDREERSNGSCLPLAGGGKGGGEAIAPLPADLALWRFGRCFSHGAIVVDWPLVIHAYAGRGCVMEDAAKARWLAQVGERAAPR